MSINSTTPVPNEFFTYLPNLSDAEIRVILLVIRQTHGWKDMKTQQRKLRDRMTYNFIIKKTGLYRSLLSKTIQSLIDLQLIIVTDHDGNKLDTPQKRKGSHALFYQFQPVCNFDDACLQFRTRPIRNSEHNKRNTFKKKILQKEQSNKLDELKQSLAQKFTFDEMQ